MPWGVDSGQFWSLDDFRLTDSRQRDSFPESKQLSFVAINREGANYDDDSRAFERRSVA